METGQECLTLATPVGRGAVATILVKATAVRRRLQPFFSSTRTEDLGSVDDRRILFGRWKSAAGSEELVVLFHSDTSAEIHCHGGLQPCQADHSFCQV